MIERRQAVRKVPIEVEVRGEVYKAEPLPWLDANELGDEILRQNAEAANSAVRMYVTDNNIPQLELALNRKIQDWQPILDKGYPGQFTPEIVRSLNPDELFELGKAALEVNYLEYLKNLLDPNFQPPTESGGTETSLKGDGQKTTSSESSSSAESTPTPSESSPEGSSSQPSTST